MWSHSKVRKEYQLRGFETEQCGNLYALCTERSFGVLGSSRRFGFIVQAPIVSTQRMARLREFIHNKSAFSAYATFNDEPSKLFSGIPHCRVCIVLSYTGAPRDNAAISTTRYHKWYKEEAPALFQLVQYESMPPSLPSAVIPKLRSSTELQLYNRILREPRTLGSLLSATPTEHRIYYKITGVSHWFTFTTSPPKFWRLAKKDHPPVRIAYVFQAPSYGTLLSASFGVRYTFGYIRLGQIVATSTRPTWTQCQSLNPSSMVCLTFRALHCKSLTGSKKRPMCVPPPTASGSCSVSTIQARRHQTDHRRH